MAARHVVLVFLLFTIASVIASTIEFRDVELSKGQTVAYRFVFIRKDESFSGTAEPTLTFNFDLGEANINSASVEAALFTPNIKSLIGVDGEYCCTSELFAAGRCPRLNKLAIDPSIAININPLPGDSFSRSIGENLFYWPNMTFYQQIGNGNSSLLVKQIIQINATSPYYFVLANCHSNTSLPLNGYIQFLNPHGHLSGFTFAYLPLYLVVLVAFAILSIVWFVFLIIKRKGLVFLQYLTFVTVVLGFLESVFYLAYYNIFNLDGLMDSGLLVMAAILTSFKELAIRVLLLLCAVGYSIWRPSLSLAYKISIPLVSLLFLGVTLTNESLGVMQELDLAHNIYSTIGTGLIAGIVNLAFIIWIGVELGRTMSALKEKPKSLSLYRILSFFLLPFIILAIVFYILGMSLENTSVRDTFWRGWWIWKAIWLVGYFLVILFVAILWRPTSNNQRYSALALQDPQGKDSIELEAGTKSSKSSKVQEEGAVDLSEASA